MTNFEKTINNGQFCRNTICCILTEVETNKTFEATINANAIREVEGKLPEGVELAHKTTLQQYFNPTTIEAYELELSNSEFIHAFNFNELLEWGFHEYMKYLRLGEFSRCMLFDANAYNPRMLKRVFGN